ncbi:hypothetical protein [Desulfoluna spongiiphila]|uniref:Uncharacterized protein n=1 Tax=Desulfoluna spongiiphila TaxID=419481 RepID=A0A1G5IEK4_9BACT|nr:hypothetical protein [Desulfoluna spongiiphila]SCY74444.1 hypothetical protein SAMN05216233_11976 [Desulfoluna spongiiphila]
MKTMGRSWLVTALLLLLWCCPAGADFMEEFKTRGRSIYLLHAVPRYPLPADTGITALSQKDMAQVNTLAATPEEGPFLPVDDIETMVKRIDGLTEEFEASKDGERLQRLRFDIAYEYFLLYLHYQKIKYGFSEDKRLPDENIPVTDAELRQYLMLSRHYLSPFLEKKEAERNRPPSLRIMDDVTFRIRGNPEAYLNVHFLAMMIEEERQAGGWNDAGSPDPINLTCDAKTWHWLETLWKRYHRKSRERVYVPSAGQLFSLYELYLRYHFLGRSLRYEDTIDPLTHTRTRTLLNRLCQLSKAAGIRGGTPYERYVEEASKDSGDTRFLVSLYLARRGFAVLRNGTLPASKAELFTLYQQYYDRAAQQVRYNIPFRKNIYNELILMGVETGNLRLMEDILYQYGLMGMRIPGPDIGERFIGDSSRFTMAYLMANILEKKRLSGLTDNSARYAEMEGNLVESLTSSANSYWRYASVFHRCLAEYYAGAHDNRNEARAIYHSRKAFLTLCKKLSLNGQGGDFDAFKDMPESRNFLGLFLYYQKKYPTSPDASTPREYRADRIIETKLQQNRS